MTWLASTGRGNMEGPPRREGIRKPATASILKTLEPATDVTGSTASPMTPSWNQVVAFLTDWERLWTMAA